MPIIRTFSCTEGKIAVPGAGRSKRITVPAAKDPTPAVLKTDEEIKDCCQVVDFPQSIYNSRTIQTDPPGVVPPVDPVDPVEPESSPVIDSPESSPVIDSPESSPSSSEALFDPLTLSPDIWYDAAIPDMAVSDGDFLVVNGGRMWPDQSGNNNHGRFGPLASVSPVWRASGFGTQSHPYVDFARSTNDALSFTSPFIVSAGATGGDATTMICCLKLQQFGPFNRNWWLNVGSVLSTFGFLASDDRYILNPDSGASGLFDTFASHSMSQFDEMIVVLRTPVSSNVHTLEINNISFGSVAVATSTFNYLGNGPPSDLNVTNNNSNTRLVEFLAWYRRLSDEEVSNVVDDYLNPKIGVF